MRVAIHQPQYLPWPGYFDKAACCDVFVYLDNVQYQKRGLQNRNKIKGADGPFWLTVPVHAGREDLIKDVVISGVDWVESHLRSIQACYRQAPGFERCYPIVADILKAGESSLCELNIRLTEAMFDWFGINCRRVRASTLDVKGAKEERMIELCRACGATMYVSGTGATVYQSAEAFARSGLELVYRMYEPVEYAQRFPKQGFVAGMSVIDLMMNEPDDGRVILDRGGRNQTTNNER
jgi:hypothetical protein